MSVREIIPTQSAYLELKAERAGMQEGYRFLDEKRLILASEILAQLRDYEDTMARWNQAQSVALAALRLAVGRHGIEELGIYPASPPTDFPSPGAPRSVLGVAVVSVPPAPLAEIPGIPAKAADPRAAPVLEQQPQQAGAATVLRTPEAEHCRACFAPLPQLAARLATLTGNLERLRREYLRTARRARALEDVLLPELDATLRAVDTALEELEREEAVRVRTLAV
ncbi:ATPase [Thiohalocapsa marina]|uniref:ATPase n=1 Tax=Thiohalocapsa marina TaxID=424902 RepID=A0A5M8FJT6_9GAMM|nr:V-type ATP synthase subunit D [Thiohalocapsa marina]KAA6184947.1 ATPase [Thiohalocapsa marina]